jgi:hypothetical protein
MTTTTDTPAYLYRMWELGEAHLAARRYVLARRELETAEALAWRDRDPAALARLYLPLLEARRQIRYHAVEGTLLICPPGTPPAREQQLLGRFFASPAGTVLLACSPQGNKPRRGKTRAARGGSGDEIACRLAGSVQYEAQKTGHWLEALLLIQHNGTGETRLAAQADPTFAAGIPVRFVAAPSSDSPPNAPLETLGESTDPALTIPLPGPGEFQGSRPGPGALARESLLVAWEALALKWQRRHPPPRSSHTHDPREAGWQEMAWLRLALRIDPACEPITMRLIALAEAVERL